jgi:hypothetical protein
MPERVCPFCGKSINVVLTRCPYCREAVPPAGVPVTTRSSASNARANMRRGLLWTLLAAVLYYFSSGRSPFTIPFPIPEFVTLYLIPLLFLAGAAMAIYGLFQSMRG